MIITKTALPRRTFLRGVGVTMALPFLDAMVPALSAIVRTAAKPVMRLGFFYVANGVTMHAWHPTGDGPNFQVSPILSALASAKDQMVVVKGLANTKAGESGSAPHTRVHASWLNGVLPKRTEGADIQAATTIDQYAAKKLGQETPLLSLELALEPNFIVGNCDAGYSCVYQNTFSWRTPTMPLPMENNPRVVFERLFGDGGSAAVQVAQMQKKRSVLDAVTKEMARLQRTLGPGDRTTVSEYFDAVREVEARIQKGEQHAETSIMAEVARPLGIPESFDEHAKLMFDLQFLAYQADVTRVVTFQISREQSQRTYPEIGVPLGHHDISHHNDDPERMALNAKINTYHVELFARLVEKMRSTPDGDGSLLDHAILLYGAGMGNGSEHSPHDLPIVLMGGGCGQLKGARHLKPPPDTSLMNLGLSLLDTVGVELESLGDSTGRLVGL